DYQYCTPMYTASTPTPYLCNSVLRTSTPHRSGGSQTLHRDSSVSRPPSRGPASNGPGPPREHPERGTPPGPGPPHRPDRRVRSATAGVPCARLAAPLRPSPLVRQPYTRVEEGRDLAPAEPPTR